MTIGFKGKIIYWRGPAPHYFVVVPDDLSAEIKAVEKLASYGWGCIPVRVRIDETEWSTSLMPKDGLYLVPIRASVRKPKGLDEGHEVELEVEIGLTGPPGE
ncbi:MAG: DUF1905 domain-containing protein [Fimbriimonadaceae bacterium]|nr:DUF1905 domain-containing protein [Fimbriimonadaceae bacterium]QYK55010.1 MAG: DUF1905 domain-containing protein [Fimbriimonadaceae bacterium]